MEKGNVKGAKPEETGPKEIRNAGALADFLKRTKSGITLTDKEAELLLGYFEGHGYLLGELDGTLYRGDLSNIHGETVWEKEEYPMDDVIDAVCEWNYELMSEEEENMENPFLTDKEEEDGRERLAGLKEDEKILDRLFDLTKYGKKLEETAQRLADTLLMAVAKSDNIDQAVAVVGEQIRQYGNGGRSR